MGEWPGILLSNFVNFPDYFYFVQGNIYADMEFLTNINGFILELNQLHKPEDVVGIKCNGKNIELLYQTVPGSTLLKMALPRFA